VTVPDAKTLSSFLTSARTRVDVALEQYLPSPPACPPLVSEAMRYSLFAGGKRLRPVLALAAAGSVSQGECGLARALPAACALEFLHTYSLIHDDLPAMDNDTLRRGRPTLHVMYGDGIAILAGDALQAEAFSLLAREPVSDEPDVVARKLRVTGVVAEAVGARGMVGGQALDLQAAGQAPGHKLALDAGGLRSMHLLKTGALIRAAAVSGALMGGANPDQLKAIERWGSHIGLAFQIVDDILDVEGNEGDLGKTAGKDAAGAKPTYPSLFGLEQSRRMAAESADCARTVLAGAHLMNGRLDEISTWVIARRH
jgi:geranylgeranyl diphosphate synthase type II